MGKIVYPELSYRIMGILFDVYNNLGRGYQERYYQIAIRKELEQAQIPYLEQVRTELEFNGESVGRYYIDFIIDGKIVLEIKAKSYFSFKDVRQVLAYLKKTKLELGILASFGGSSLNYRRILKGYQANNSGQFEGFGYNSSFKIRELEKRNISDKFEYHKSKL